MLNVYIYSWNNVSNGAKALSEELNCMRIKHANSRFKPSPHKKVINWGASSVPNLLCDVFMFNEPDKVGACSNKLRFFLNQTLPSLAEPARLPQFTTDQGRAQEWLDEGRLVCVRHKLQGCGGDGLDIYSAPTDPDKSCPKLPKAPLYTLYVKKKEEYRVHIFRGEIIDYQRKALSSKHEGEANFMIRNLANGFVFVRENVVLPKDVEKQALRAFNHSGLDFGAVDVVYNEKEGQAYVLEINCAPGLEGSTVKSYADAFLKVL